MSSFFCRNFGYTKKKTNKDKKFFSLNRYINKINKDKNKTLQNISFNVSLLADCETQSDTLNN